MTAKEIWTEKNREKLRLQQAARDAKKRAEREADPEKMREYKERRRAEYLAKHPNAMTAEEYNNRGSRRRFVPSDTRTCSDCGTLKHKDEFPRHGTHGRKEYCLACSELRKKASRKTIQKAYVSRNREKVNKVKNEWAKKHKPVAKAKEPKERKFRKPAPSATDGWIKVFAEADPHESLTVWRRGPLLMFQRCQLGVYSLGKRSWAVVGDDSGKRYETLGRAEVAAKRLYGTGRELSA